MKSKLTLALVLALTPLSGCVSSSDFDKLQSDVESFKLEMSNRMADTEYKLQVQTCHTDTLICLIQTKDLNQEKLNACLAFNKQCIMDARGSYMSKTGKQVSEDQKAAED